MREFKIQKNDAGQRLDKFLTKAVPSLPMSLMYKSIRIKKIKVNRKRTAQNYVLMEGDTVQLFLGEDLFGGTGEDAQALLRIRPHLSVLYEDGNVLLLNKRPGVLVHEDKADNENTLITHVKAYLAQKGEYDPASEQSFAPALCNRIDRNTGGIVIAAKNAQALRDMNELIRNDDLSKFYLCEVHGSMPKKGDTLSAYLRKDEKHNLVTVTDEPLPGSKPIVTRYRVLAENERAGKSLLEIELITGRTHQIRAHLSHIGHNLVGDGKYGVNRQDREAGYRYQALYAYKLVFHDTFTNPDTVLDSLRGKTVRIPEEDVWFLSDYDLKELP